jgi:hypothetical protein
MKFNSLFQNTNLPHFRLSNGILLVKMPTKSKKVLFDVSRFAWVERKTVARLGNNKRIFEFKVCHGLSLNPTQTVTHRPMLFIFYRSNYYSFSKTTSTISESHKTLFQSILNQP